MLFFLTFNSSKNLGKNITDSLQITAVNIDEQISILEWFLKDPVTLKTENVKYRTQHLKWIETFHQSYPKTLNQNAS